jgi:alkylation response protein AidB-like acyl-CoA dehydrogenase
MVQLDYPPGAREFAETIRRFVRANLDPATREKDLHGKLANRQERTAWQRALAGAGWGAPGWPVQYGGPGWSAVQRHLFDEVLSEEGAPAAPVFGMGMLAPVLMRFGSEHQKSHFLPRMVTLEDWWCQGFSEPGAGSDLASLRTRAVQDGDDWLINGQKIWTTLAHWADWMFCLVRTSDEPKKQMGISMFLIDMKSPGLTVRPIITIDGEHEVNEVFLTDVRVPAANIVGQVGHGWDYAKYLLSHERSGIARVGHSRRQIRRLLAIAAVEPTPTGMLGDDPAFRLKVARLQIRLKALELTGLRMLANQQSGVPPGSEANLLKIKGSEIQQDISELMMDAAGRYAFAYDHHAWSDGAHPDPIGPDYAATLAGVYFNTRKVSIYGGSNEIQRNLLAKIALGL